MAAISPFLVRRWPTLYQNFQNSKHFKIGLVKLGLLEILGPCCQNGLKWQYFEVYKFWQHWTKFSGNPNFTILILKCLLFWKFWYKVGQCRTKNGEMAAILIFRFCFVPTYCIFSIFGTALPPFNATFLPVILLREQSYDIQMCAGA